MEHMIVVVIVLAILSALIPPVTKKKRRSAKNRQSSIWSELRGMLAGLKGEEQGRSVADDFEMIGPLLSDAELNFYRLLLKVLAHPNDPQGSPQAVVMSKVRVPDLIRVRKGLDRSERSSAFNRIKAKHVDFVLCEPGTMRVMCVIELDDKSHRSEKVQRRDALMDSIYAAAGLPILHVDCRRGYSIQEVGGMIREAVGGGWVSKWFHYGLLRSSSRRRALAKDFS